MSIKDIVKDASAEFLYYADGSLWYKTSTGFKFPIPIEDTKGAFFNRTHKAITLMRWIRKHSELISENTCGINSNFEI